MAGTISKEVAKDLMERCDIKIIDVRETDEYAQSRIENAINIPLSKLSKEEIEKYDFCKDDNLLIYCHAGIRSGRAVELFNELGYKKAVNIGGIVEWKDKVIF